MPAAPFLPEAAGLQSPFKIEGREVFKLTATFSFAKTFLFNTFLRD
jgi:hypothetical protein